jgi:hypothetical protein
MVTVAVILTKTSMTMRMVLTTLKMTVLQLLEHQRSVPQDVLTQTAMAGPIPTMTVRLKQVTQHLAGRMHALTPMETAGQTPMMLSRTSQRNGPMEMQTTMVTTSKAFPLTIVPQYPELQL